MRLTEHTKELYQVRPSCKLYVTSSFLMQHYEVLLFIYDTVNLKMTAGSYFETFMQIT